MNKFFILFSFLILMRYSINELYPEELINKINEEIIK